MSLRAIMISTCLLLPVTTVGAQWQVGASTGRYMYSGSRPFLSTSANPQLFRRAMLGTDGIDIHAFAFKALSSRLDLGIELGYSKLALTGISYNSASLTYSDLGQRGSGSQYLALAKLRFKISDSDWKLRIETTAGAGFISQRGLQSVDRDATSSTTRALGQLGVAVGYPLSRQLELRLEHSWYFYNAGSDRTGLITSTKAVHDRRFSIGFAFSP